MKLESNDKVIAEAAASAVQPDSRYFHNVDYDTISNEIIGVLEKHKVRVGTLEDVFHDVRIKVNFYSPVQNYRGDPD